MNEPSSDTLDALKAALDAPGQFDPDDARRVLTDLLAPAMRAQGCVACRFDCWILWGNLDPDVDATFIAPERFEGEGPYSCLNEFKSEYEICSNGYEDSAQSLYPVARNEGGKPVDVTMLSESTAKAILDRYFDEMRASRIKIDFNDAGGQGRLIVDAATELGRVEGLAGDYIRDGEGLIYGMLYTDPDGPAPPGLFIFQLGDFAWPDDFY